MGSILLSACNSGSNIGSSSAQSGSPTANNLQEYVNKLSYSPLSDKNASEVVNKLQSGSSSYQQSFTLSSTMTLSEIDINYYSDSSCGTNVLQAEVKLSGGIGGVVLNPGTYTSTDASNYALCSKYANGNSKNCGGLLTDAKASTKGWSMQYTYIEKGSSGNITHTGPCMVNASNLNSLSESMEVIADYSGGISSRKGCSANSCGYSQSYNSINLGQFFGYSPVNCTLNNAGAKITGTCTCLEDQGGNIWYTNGSKYSGTWTDWCSQTGPAADKNCSADGSSLVSFNKTSHCGEAIPGNWHLPTMTSPGNGEYISSSYNPGGDWGVIATAAVANGYQSQGDLSKWMNDNGFSGVMSDFYWSSQSSDNDDSWDVNMNDGYVRYDNQYAYDGVVLVRSGQ